MGRAAGYLIAALEAVLVALLAAMAIMVFVNVVLRYGFNTGINISEEVARYFFVWLTFTGAVLAFREHAHLGVESFVRLLGRGGRLLCMAMTNLIIIMCSVVLFVGTWKQMPINASMVAPVTGLPMVYIFGVTFFTAAGIGLIAALRLLRVLNGSVSDAEMAAFVGAQDARDAGRSE